MGHGPRHADLQKQMELCKLNSHLEFAVLPSCIVGQSNKCQRNVQKDSMRQESTGGLENTGM